MDYHSKPSKDDLKSYLHKFNNCEECRLHKNRKHLITGKGSIDASVVILLDRVSFAAACSGDIMSGGEGKVLQQVLRFVAEDYPIIRTKYLWVTSVVACPTQRLGGRAVEMLPAPTAKEQVACSPRLSGEIHKIQPEIILCCGSAAHKALRIDGSYDESLGRVVEATIHGDTREYRVPAMVTYSMNQLYRNPAQNVGGMWNKTVGHAKQAVKISKILAEKRSIE